MADEGLDELFGGGQGQPRPRTTLALALLVTGLVLTVLGMACSAAPGGIIVLLAWVVVDRELDRVESGYLSTEFKPRLIALRNATYVSVVVVVALFALQFWLLRKGFYDDLWGFFILVMRARIGAL